MDLNSLPIMAALKKRMSWLTQNQRVIAENVANADTPGYLAKKLEGQDFSSLLDRVNADRYTSGVVEGPKGPRGPRGPRMGGASTVEGTREDVDESGPVSPRGNSVVLEEEMLKLADNQMEHGLVVNIYKKNIALLRSSLGRRGI